MILVLGYLGVTLAVLVAAWMCRAIFVPRLSGGRTSYATASVTTLAVLLGTPTLAATLAAAGAATRDVAGAPIFFYLGYAVGLVCFIVLNRRYRDLRPG